MKSSLVILTFNEIEGSKAIYDKRLDWHDYVEIDPNYFRPAEVDILRGDPSKAREKLNWEPSLKFHELVQLMVDADLEETRRKYHL